MSSWVAVALAHKDGLWSSFGVSLVFSCLWVLVFALFNFHFVVPRRILLILVQVEYGDTQGEDSMSPLSGSGLTLRSHSALSCRRKLQKKNWQHTW